ncbi:MAG: hypothetical protein WD737_01655 [Gemmatimonadota bacterium]
MTTTLVLVLYTITASFISAYVFYFGVVMRPRVRLFTTAEYALLSLTAVGVGLFWVLFVPGLLTLGARHAARHVRAGDGHFQVGRPEQARVGP